MKIVRTLCLGLLMLGVGLSVGAEEAARPPGFSGEVGTEAAFLPDLGLEAWVDLYWNLDGLGIGTLTTLDVLPGFGLGEGLTARYDLEPFWFEGRFGLSIVPLGVTDLRLIAGVALLEFEGEDLTFGMDVELVLRALPVFGLTFGLDLDLEVWDIDLWANAELDILTIAFDARLGGRARVLNLSWEGGRLSAIFRASTVLLPTFDGAIGFDVLFEAGAFELRSVTDIDLVPFGLIEQRLELAFTFDGLEVYAWGGFRGDLSFLAGIGVTYTLPSGGPPPDTND